MKNEVTYQELKIFTTSATAYLNAYPEQTVLSITLQRVIKVLTRKVEDYDFKINNERIRLAVKDETTKAVIMKDNQYQFKQEDLLALEKFVLEEGRKTLSVKPIYVGSKELPATLAYSFRRAFENFVIEPIIYKDDEEDEVSKNGVEAKLETV